MTMGTVINFPEVRRGDRSSRTTVSGEGGVIVILPVVRIERSDHQPPDEMSNRPQAAPGRRRRRRARRS
jgi:hypothetical protein